MNTLLPASVYDRLVRPESIAVVGASDSNFYASYVIKNLADAGFAGRVVPVNPREQDVAGIATVPSLAVAGRDIDAVVVAVRRELVADVIREGLAENAGGFIVLTAGFRESGDATWVQVDRELADLTLQSGVPMVGPNCLGVIAPRSGAVMYGAPLPWPVRPGRIGLVAQSGGLVSAATRYLAALDGGVAYALSIGNGSAFGVAAATSWLTTQSDVRAIGLIVEEVDDWSVLRKACEQAADAGISVSAFMIGRSPRGRQSAASHTGSMAADFPVFRSLTEAMGIRVFPNLGEMIVSLALDDKFERPAVGGVAILTSSGGNVGLIADQSHDVGLNLASFEVRTIRLIEGERHEASTMRAENPLDVSGKFLLENERAEGIIAGIARDKHVGAVVYAAGIGLPDEHLVRHMHVLERVATFAAASGIPTIVTQPIYSAATAWQVDRLRALPGVLVAPVLRDLLGGLATWLPAENAMPEVSSRSTSAQWLDEPQLKQLLRDRGLRTPTATVVRAGAGASDEGPAVPDGLDAGGLYIIKGIADGVVHKSAAGLVSGPHKGADVAVGMQEVSESAKAGRIRLNGLMIEEFIPADGADLIVSAVSTRGGYIGMVGIGGVDVEALNRRQFILLPSSEADVTRALDTIGVQRWPGLESEVAACLDAIFAIAKIQGADVLECNPIRFLPGKSYVLDAVGELRSDTGAVA